MFMTQNGRRITPATVIPQSLLSEVARVRGSRSSKPDLVPNTEQRSSWRIIELGSWWNGAICVSTLPCKSIAFFRTFTESQLHAPHLEFPYHHQVRTSRLFRPCKEITSGF